MAINAYIFRFSDDEGNKFELPITPESYEISAENKNNTVVLADFGEINVLRRPGLRTISFDVFFPFLPMPSANYPKGFQKPEYYTDLLSGWRENRKPVEFMIMRNAPDLSEIWKTTALKVAVEEMDYSENWRMNGIGIQVRLVLKAWQEYSVKLYEKATDGTFREKQAENEPLPVIGRVETAKDNTTFFNESMRLYDDGGFAGLIEQANKDMGEYNPMLGIPEGTAYKTGEELWRKSKSQTK